MAQELGTTPDTASAAFNRLRYAMTVETNTTSQPVSDNNKSESKASTVSRQDTGELRNMGKRFDTLLGTASATTNRLNYVTDAPERGTSPKLGMTCGTSAEETILDKDKDGTASRAECNAGFDSFDTDENDYITAKEFSAVAHQGFVFDALDCDGDGKITREEYNAGFDTMDLNKDGTLSREEFNSAIFSMLDTDGDGLLSREEYEAGFDRLDFQYSVFSNCSATVTVTPSGPIKLFKGGTTAMSGVLARFPLLLPIRNPFASYGASAVTRTRDRGHVAEVKKPISSGFGASIRVSKETFLPLNVHLCGQFEA